MDRRITEERGTRTRTGLAVSSQRSAGPGSRYCSLHGLQEASNDNPRHKNRTMSPKPCCCIGIACRPRWGFSPVLAADRAASVPCSDCAVGAARSPTSTARSSPDEYSAAPGMARRGAVRCRTCPLGPGVPKGAELRRERRGEEVRVRGANIVYEDTYCQPAAVPVF